MGLSKTGEVYRFDWITLVSQGHNLFKLVSNSGTEVEQVHGADAKNVRDAVKDTLVSMSPQNRLSTPRAATRLKIQHTADIADPM